jgi:hypothetical protein
MVTTERRTLITGGDPAARFLPPRDEQFEEAGDDFLPAPDLERIGSALIAGHEARFGHLQSREVVFLWKRKGGAAGGKPTLGKCQRPTGLLKHFAGVDFVIWAAADHCRAVQMAAYQVEGLLFHELLHAGEDNEGRAVIWPHDFTGFRAEVEEYGAWKPDLSDAARSFGQMRMFGE